MNWIERGDVLHPPKNRVLIAYCPEWCDTEYQICKWNGKEFYYDDVPNEMFDSTVIKWAIFLEAD